MDSLVYTLQSGSTQKKLEKREQLFDSRGG